MHSSHERGRTWQPDQVQPLTSGGGGTWTPTHVPAPLPGEPARGVGDLATAYGAHGPSVFQVALQICGPTEAEHVTATVFLALWRTPSAFATEPDRLRASLVAAAHLDAVTRVRSQREPVHGEAVISTADAEQAALAESGGEQRSQLSGLPEVERQVIQLAYFGGYTCREIATFLDLSEKVVIGNIRLGMAHFRALAGNQGSRKV